MALDHRSTRPIVYVYPKRFHFVAKDIDALSRDQVVLEHGFLSGPVWLVPFDLVRQLLFLLVAKAKGVKVVLAHFAGFHTTLPVLLGFRTHIIVAGSDACSFPGIRYGSFRKPMMRWAMTYSMRGASTILPVHASLERFSNTFSEFGPKEQGYAHFIPAMHDRSIAIPYGFDAAFWRPTGASREPRSSICVAFGAANGNAVHFRKGVDLIMEAASHMPDHRFTIVGLVAPASYGSTPQNVHLHGKVPPSELAAMFNSHGNVLQPSVMEGFPNAVCEAMLCGCIPIVADITSMPSIIGSAGGVLRQRDPGALIMEIRKIEDLPSAEIDRQRAEARNRIAAFTIEERMERIEAVLSAT
ncbi:MAG: glycosyltransferase family 4 protein [Flavobacteriales bacterium]|nr:glycosyltransferase family 4 protein [Flavobacteriales bacterium]